MIRKLMFSYKTKCLIGVSNWSIFTHNPLCDEMNGIDELP